MPVVFNGQNDVIKAADIFKSAAKNREMSELPQVAAPADVVEDVHPKEMHVIHENADPRVGEQIIGAHSFNMERVAELLSDPLLQEDI